MASKNTVRLNLSPSGSPESLSKSPSLSSKPPSLQLQNLPQNSGFTSAEYMRFSPPPPLGVFEPFNKNRLEWDVFDQSKSRDNDQAIADELKSLVSDIDNSGILGDYHTEETSSREMKSMPMNRTFLFQEGVDARYPRLDDLLMLYRMEEGLAINMLTMISDDTAQDFSSSIGYSKEETGEQKFRRDAINRCALRQALTETTDAAARGCNLVKLVVEPFDPESDLADLQFPDELADDLAEEDRKRSRWTSRRDVEASDTLESFFSVCQAPNELEIDYLSQYLGLEKDSVHDWFKGKQQRVEHLFVTRKLPQGNSVRMLDHRMRRSLHDIFPPRLDTYRPASSP